MPYAPGIAMTKAERAARRHSDHIPTFEPGFHVYTIQQSWRTKKWLLFQDARVVAEYDFRNDAERARTALYDQQFAWKLEWVHGRAALAE